MNRCIHIQGDGAKFIDPLTLYNETEHKTMGVSDSKLLPSLRKTRVHVSPLLMFYSESYAELERAFVVLPEAGAAPTVLLCTLVELWARALSREMSQRGEYAAYTANGLLVRATTSATASEGDVLFGRFLCGDPLTRIEQVALFGYLKSRYESSEADISKVLACLVSSRIMPKPAGLLHLVLDEAWARHDSTKPPPDVAFVRKLLEPAFGSVTGQVRTGARAFV